jgi:hypothetical protein
MRCEWQESSRGHWFVVAAAALALTAGCVDQATVPVVPRSGESAARDQAYEASKLTYDKGFWSSSWKRADGDYNWGSLENVAKSYPESEDVYSRANSRGIVVGSIAGIGGGLIGYTLGYNLTAQSDKKMSSDAQVALYATGGGFILLSAIVGAAWHNPMDDFATVYNRNLRRDLGLPPEPQRAAGFRQKFRLRPLVAGDSVGFTFD